MRWPVLTLTLLTLLFGVPVFVQAQQVIVESEPNGTPNEATPGEPLGPDGVVIVGSCGNAEVRNPDGDWFTVPLEGGKRYSTMLNAYPDDATPCFFFVGPSPDQMSPRSVQFEVEEGEGGNWYVFVTELECLDTGDPQQECPPPLNYELTIREIVEIDLDVTEFDFEIVTSQGTIANDVLAIDSQFFAIAKIRSSGGAVNHPVTVKMYLSLDPVITSDDIEIASESVASLPANTDVPVGFSVINGLPSNQIDPSVYFGTVWLGVVVDPENSVAETDEANNTAVEDVRLFDPVAPRYNPQYPADMSYYFATKKDAERFLSQNGFYKILGLDSGWNANFPGAVVSYRNGETMPSGSFRIQASDPFMDPQNSLWRSNTFQGAMPSFNPFGLSPEIGEPKPADFGRGLFVTIECILLDIGWYPYVWEYHQLF